MRKRITTNEANSPGVTFEALSSRPPRRMLGSEPFCSTKDAEGQHGTRIRIRTKATKSRSQIQQ